MYILLTFSLVFFAILIAPLAAMHTNKRCFEQSPKQTFTTRMLYNDSTDNFTLTHVTRDRVTVVCVFLKLKLNEFIHAIAEPGKVTQHYITCLEQRVVTAA